MRRRQFLAAAGAALPVALAGCHGPPRVELQLTPLREADLGELLVTTADDLDSQESSAVRLAHENGSYVETATDESRPLLDDGEAVRYDGQVFAVRTVRVAVESRTLQTFEVTYIGRGDNTTVELDEDARVVSYGDLPPADREMFDDAHPEHLSRAGSAESSYPRLVYPDDAESVFVPEQEYDAVRYEGRTFRVEYNGRYVDDNGRFRYELEPVAPDIETYADRVVDEHVFTLDRTDLSEEQREMVATAIDEERYVEEGEASDAFAALIERIHSNDHVDRSVGELSYVLRYEGTTYLSTVDALNHDVPTTEPYHTTTEGEDGGDTTTNGTTAAPTTTPSG
ncbi:hypothetical protein [Haloarchaeobius salinus]|uniref:hypothetical protein n=1 Tax=Haloarchaeobius salinus TaxID=1198298 RepID=UPI00210E4473|nr:hypothetical protein [Haloarchaeobius salinus]